MRLHTVTFSDGRRINVLAASKWHAMDQVANRFGVDRKKLKSKPKLI